MESLFDNYGYEDGIFVLEPAEYLRCAVCSLVLRDPLMVLRCGHKFCTVCFERLKSRSQVNNTDLHCPIDRDTINVVGVHEDVALKRLIGNLEVRCPEREKGCTWSGDLRDLNLHSGRCIYQQQQQHAGQKGGTTLLNKNTLEIIYNRLDRCDNVLFEKDKEIAALNDSMEYCKEQVKKLEGEVALLKKLIIETQQKNYQVLKQQQNEQQKNMNALVSEVASLRKELASLRNEKHNELVPNTSNGINNNNNNHGISDSNLSFVKLRIDHTSELKADKMVEIKATEAEEINNCSSIRKNITIQRRSGRPQDVVISNEFCIDFGSLFATVSAHDAVVPHGSKVWYEVEYHENTSHGRSHQVGWSTANLPTSVTYSGKGVGDRADSYGFNPFTGYKWHDGSTRWSKKFGERNIGCVGVALDLLNGEVLFSVDGEWDVAFNDVPKNVRLFPALSGISAKLQINFGDRAARYGPPDSSFVTLWEALA